MIFKPNSNLMKGLNLASSVKSLLSAAGVLVLLMLFFGRTDAQTLDSSSPLTGVVSKNTTHLLSNANWVGEQEAVQALMDARAQVANQMGAVTTKAEKANLSVRYDYYFVLVKEIKNGSTVPNAVTNTYDRLAAMCAEMDNLVSPESVLQDVVTVLTN
ncbi:MAG: hypothetical protein D6706_21750 [Chloroflexi bacterium]|nr:MAG: hypothetical protein D6706_21750 [Chloroflexota bacterium]